MFNKQNFCHVASNNRNEQKAGIFVYRTTDNLQTVTTSGYFNEKLVDINLHDLIIHEQTDNADKTKVVYNILCVTERTLDNVGTQTILTDWEKALVVPTKLSDLTGDVAIVNPTNGQQLVYNSTTQKWENAAGGSGLPDQTGNAGKFLTTDGTDASWGTTLTETLYLTGDNTQEKIIFNWGTNSSNNIICRATDYSLLFGYRNGGTFRQEFVFDWLYKSFHPINWQSSAIVTLGTSDYKWSNVYTKKINNGADIEVPNQAGTMVVANPTGATQGQVLTLDNNLTPAWADASGGLPSTTGATQGQVLALDGNLEPQWATQSVDPHRVIEFQAPTADNNYTWYRLYADGWVEQGGRVDVQSVPANTSQNISLPVTMVDDKYAISLQEYTNSTNISNENANYIYSQTTTGFAWRHTAYGGNTQTMGVIWQVSGMSAS